VSNRIYPNWAQLQQLHAPLTSGETALLRFLDQHLPRDPNWTEGQKLSRYQGWLIFVQPHFNGCRPDVVIFHPSVGLIIYEVKDWQLDLYENKNGQVTVKTGQGTKAVTKSPVSQVRHYRDKLIGQLVPLIGEAIDQRQVVVYTVRTGLYFHCSSTEKARKIFGKPHAYEDKQKGPPLDLIFGKDWLTSDCLAEIVPSFQEQGSYYWQPAWTEEVLFWLFPPYHSIEQGTALRLKGSQLKLAEPSSGHYRARGVAGGGKTQALAYRAGNLASQGLQVLIISFNITLWHYVKDMIARAPFAFSWKQFTFAHFHGFCKDRLNEFGHRWPKSPKPQEFDDYKAYETALADFFRAAVPAAVVNALQDNGYQKYDAILVDEGQDYYFEWYNLLDKHFLTERDEMLVVCDKRQNIYERELDWLDKRVTRVGLDKFKTPYIDLTVSFRLPKRVAALANDFSISFNLNQELKVGKFEDLPALLHSQHIIWVEIEPSQWLDYLHYAYRRLKKEGYSASDMVMLLPTHEVGLKAVDSFHKIRVETNHVFETTSQSSFHPNKRAFWMGDSRLKMSTIHSFKGWELLNIIMYIPDQAAESDTQLDAMVYTALTRTKENLIVLNANPRYQKFGKVFPKTWQDQ
jgi:hypothetical protein